MRSYDHVKRDHHGNDKVGVSKEEREEWAARRAGNLKSTWEPMLAQGMGASSIAKEGCWWRRWKREY